MTPATFGVGIPSAIGTAITAIYESGAKGVDSAVLVCLVHSMDWKSCAGSTGIPSDSIADRIGASRSTVVDALGRLESSGVLTFPPYENGRPKDRTIRWDVLRTYASPSTRRGGDRTSDGSGNRTGPVIGQGVTEVRSGTCPVIGQGVTEHRSLILMSPPVSPPTSTKNAPAPAPAVADLFTPPSQPDSATGDAAGDTAPPPSCAAPLPKPKRAKRGPSPEAVAAWPVALAWWARVRPENAARLKMERGDGALLLEALDKQGIDVIVGRLRQAAIGTVYMARQVRGEVNGRDAVDGLPALLRAQTGITTPLDSAAEAEGYGTATAGEDEATANARSEAGTAWFDMTTRRAWQTVNVVYFNAPDDFGATTGFDLADTPAEHARRANAFKAAGSQPGWKRAGENGGAGKAAFRERFLTAYAAGVSL